MRRSQPVHGIVPTFVPCPIRSVIGNSKESAVMPGQSRCVGNLSAVVVMAGAIAGCTATADMSYGEYQFGPGYQAEQIYERRIYADTGRGLGSQECRTVGQEYVDRFGEVVRRDTQVCDDDGPVAGE